jgi:prevent-host-death family protein
MKTIEISKATEPLRQYAENARNGVVVVTRRGKPVAAVIGADQFDLESLSLSTNPKFVEVIRRSRESLERYGGIPADEVRRRLGLPPAKTRRKRKA